MNSSLEELERRGWEALSGPNGVAFYDGLMADDGVMVFPGLALDKPATLRAIAAERPWRTFELGDVQVLPLGTEGAVVTYRATAVRDGEPPYDAMMSTAYARRDGRWRLVLHQQTPAPR